jgi:hypothetical protein
MASKDIVIGLALLTIATVASAQDAVSRVPDGLADLNAVTFSCPKAALNAAARQAVKAPSQGTYQFAYFKIINNAHHAAYEVHFKSNYEGEPDLRYCVEMYCQQGFDPATTKTTLTLMSTQRAGVKTHGAACGGHQPAVTHRAK